MKMQTDEHLKAIFANVNDWLKFAETKSSILIAADAAASVGALAVLIQNWKELASFWIVYLHQFVFFVVVSAVIAMFAIIPRTAALLRKNQEKPSDDDNFLFAGHLAKYEPLDFLRRLKERQGDSNEHSAMQLDYAQQIVVNSCIATTKFNLFWIASWFAITAIITPVISVPLFLRLNNLHTKFMAKVRDWRRRTKKKRNERPK